MVATRLWSQSCRQRLSINRVYPLKLYFQIPCVFPVQPRIFPVPIYIICEYYKHRTDLADLSSFWEKNGNFLGKYRRIPNSLCFPCAVGTLYITEWVKNGLGCCPPPSPTHNLPPPNTHTHTSLPKHGRRPLQPYAIGVNRRFFKYTCDVGFFSIVTCSLWFYWHVTDNVKRWWTATRREM